MRLNLYLSLLSLLLLPQAFADIKIIELDETDTDQLGMFLDSGEIVKIDRSNEAAVLIARDAFNTKDSIKILKKKSFKETPDIALILEIVAGDRPFTPMARTNKNMYSRDAFNAINFTSLDPLEKSNISVLPSYEIAQAIMNNINGGTDDDSECYNRAHMWTYEALIRDNVNLGKLWIFFTKKYTRAFNYKWWFHVAPYTHVNDDNVRYVLDRGFHTVPFNVRSWTDYFMKNRAECRVVADYNDYDKHSDIEHCYLIFSSQYYWQPWQLERLSERETRFWGYKEGELKITYPDALIRGTWNRVIPTLDPRIHNGKRFPVATNGRLDEGRTSSTPDTDSEARRERERAEREAREREERNRPSAERNGVPYINVSYQIGDDVIDNNFRTGEIENVISSDQVVVDYDNSNMDSILDVRLIGKRLRSRVFNLAEGDRVAIGNNRTGKIDRLYSNGIFRIDFDGYSDAYVRFSQGIAGEVRSIGGFQRNDDIVDNNGNKGEIERVYSNGLALVDWKSYSDSLIDVRNIRHR